MLIIKVCDKSKTFIINNLAFKFEKLNKISIFTKTVLYKNRYLLFIKYSKL